MRCATESTMTSNVPISQYTFFDCISPMVVVSLRLFYLSVFSSYLRTCVRFLPAALLTNGLQTPSDVLLFQERK